MSDDTIHVLHYKRQFLGSEHDGHYERANCFSYVYYDTDKDGIEVEAEFCLSDGYHDVVNLDGTRFDDQDEYLALLTRLMEQIIAYRQAYAQALALARSQPVTGGGTVLVELSGDFSKTD